MITPYSSLRLKRTTITDIRQSVKLEYRTLFALLSVLIYSRSSAAARHEQRSQWCLAIRMVNGGVLKNGYYQQHLGLRLGVSGISSVIRLFGWGPANARKREVIRTGPRVVKGMCLGDGNNETRTRRYTNPWRTQPCRAASTPLFSPMKTEPVSSAPVRGSGQGRMG
ncbi:hypothetical protein LIPSTDRAFT_290521 [Lipomyces starkeyi NRRL Y-11557]|uniref:Uncharacterized protein n=1 Tax=Lipomyces starkeyi NRRL Y-11557 TaxID=675824 RepID=A0A1E3Q6N2_LIPST|nr:hypothetical protein LIPSTDRAFT_290521 [Lipomyces starkeyi NRRL Y-11557]